MPPTTTVQSFQRNRQRLVAQEDFARRLQEETRDFRNVEYENQAEKLLASRTAWPQRQEDIAREKERALEAAAEQRRLDEEKRREEERAWEAELARTVETPEERKAKLKTQALALKARNEAARQAFVEACYERQWRDACDEARLLDSDALERYVTQACLDQVREKAARREQLSKEEALVLRQIEAHDARLAAEEARRAASRAARKAETVATLGSQVALRQARTAEESAAAAAEDARELARAAQALREEEAKAEARRAEARRLGEETWAFSQRRLGLRQAAKEEARQQDLALLEYALATEQADQAAEAARKQRAVRENRTYQAYLTELMAKEAEDEAAINRARERQEAEVWDQRDAALRRQAEARAALWRGVDEGRREQLRLKARAAAEEAAREAEQLAAWEEENAKGAEEEARQAALRRAAVRENAARLQEQVEARRRREQLEKQAEYLQHKHMLKAEAEHQERLRRQAGRVRLHHPLASLPWTSSSP